jgi:cell wall-associated NlpC family hydrolase
MSEDKQRQAVIDEAKSWLKTPHHNGARLKGIGVDCGQLPLVVYEAVGLIPHVETERYSHQFHLNRSKEWYLDYCQSLGTELVDGKLPGKGDFALYKVGRVFSHGAIVIEWPLIIHSYVGVGVTIDHGNQGWMAANKDGSPRSIKFFTLW